MIDHSFAQSRAEDRGFIHAVIHRYAHNAREGMFDPRVEGINMDHMVPIFTPDATIVLPFGREIPAKDLELVVRGDEATYIRHHVTTVDIRWRGDDEAEAFTAFIAITDEAAPDHWGHWHDILRRQTDGIWLIARREIVTEGEAPGGWRARVAKTPRT